MKSYLNVLLLLMMAVMLGCAGGQPTPTPPFPVVGIDPTLTWQPVTTDCVSAAITGVTYNVYIATGAGPLPTITTPATDIPCGAFTLIDNTKVTAVNTVPITATTYTTTLGSGTYTVAVESVAAGGARGGFTSSTFTVVDRGKATTSVNVGP